MTVSLESWMLPDAVALALEAGSHLDLPEVAGVYVIVNSATGAVYVGQSLNMKQRAIAHMVQLRAKDHQNHLLTEDAEKYGHDVFRFAVVCLSEESRLLDLEREAIAEAKKRDCYNLVGGEEAKTPAQRQADRKARQLAAGLVQWKRWVHPDDVPALVEYADKLERKRAKAARAKT